MKLYDGVRVVLVNITYIFDCFMHDDEYVYEQLVHFQCEHFSGFQISEIQFERKCGRHHRIYLQNQRI